VGENGASVTLRLRPVTERPAPIFPLVSEGRAWMNARVRVRAARLVDRQQTRCDVQTNRWILRKVPKPSETKSRPLTAASSDRNDVRDDDQIRANLLHLET